MCEHTQSLYFKYSAACRSSQQSLPYFCTVHTGCNSQRKGFGNRSERLCYHNLIARFAHLPGTMITDMNNVFSHHLQYTQCFLKYAGLTPHHDGERPIDRSLAATRNRCIKHVDFFCASADAI